MARLCTIEGCDRIHWARGYCKMHWKRWRRHGNPMQAKYRATGATLADRLWERVQRGTDDECWPWIGDAVRKEYGRFRFNGRMYSAHRVAYERSNGPIPSGLSVCHRCDNPRCCNPAHLFVGTNADNTADAKHKGRIAHGEHHTKAKLTVADVRDIRRLSSEGMSVRLLCARFGVNQATMYKVLRRQTWRHVD